MGWIGRRLQGVTILSNLIGRRLTRNLVVAFEDVVLALARKQSATAYKGLWSEVSMMNHSCVPNAFKYAIGNRVRAVVFYKLGRRGEGTAQVIGILCCSTSFVNCCHGCVYVDIHALVRS